MPDTQIEILRYEAKWFKGSEWETCTKEDYEMILQGTIDGRTYADGTRAECRVVGIVKDPAGLLLPGPKGFNSWRAAAVHEKATRINLERQLYDLREADPLQQKLNEIRAIIDRDDA
jgi:hypothetical protein